MAFGSIVFTTRGKVLQSKAQTGTKLNFTKLAIGDGELGSQSVLELTDLKNKKLDIPISSLKVLTGGLASVGGTFTNEDVESGFYWRELGLYAIDPDVGEILYCYGNAGALAEYIPSSGGSEILEKFVAIETIIGNAENVSAIINQSLVYATIEDIESHNSDPKAHSDIRVLIENINVQGDVEEVVNRRLNLDISKPLGTLISEWINTAKTAILNGINGLPQKSVWTDARGAKLDNLNQSMTTTQTNINNHINNKANQILAEINKISIDGKREARKAISITNTTALQRMVYVTGRGEIYDAYLKISRSGTEMCQIGLKIIVDGTVVAWVEGSGIWIADSVLGIISANNEVATWASGLSFPSSSKVTITEFQHLRLNNPIKFNSSFEVLAYYKSTNSTVCNVSYALL